METTETAPATGPVVSGAIADLRAVPLAVLVKRAQAALEGPSFNSSI